MESLRDVSALGTQAHKLRLDPGVESLGDGFNLANCVGDISRLEGYPAGVWCPGILCVDTHPKAVEDFGVTLERISFR